MVREKNEEAWIEWKFFIKCLVIPKIGVDHFPKIQQEIKDRDIIKFVKMRCHNYNLCLWFIGNQLSMKADLFEKSLNLPKIVSLAIPKK